MSGLINVMPGLGPLLHDVGVHLERVDQLLRQSLLGNAGEKRGGLTRSKTESFSLSPGYFRGLTSTLTLTTNYTAVCL